ncbi:MAG: putative Ig domain-containing protein [Candidatus Kapaibacterium sp.]
MKTLLITIFYTFLLSVCYAQPIPTDSLYLGQVPPGYTAKIFVLPMNGTMRPVERITITSDGKEIYFCEIDTYPANVQRIKCFKYLNDKWQGPFVVFEGYMDPALSMNDSIMYMETNVNTFATAYYSVRNSTGWSAPVRRLSTNQFTHYFQETNLKNYYMSASFPGITSKDLGCLLINGIDTTIMNLGKPINTSMNENDFFVARDESYIIHARSSSSVTGDLYISYKKSDGGWTNSKSLGPQVNLPSPTWEFGCYVTIDNNYLFFTRGGNAWSSYYIYWVRIDNLIDSLKHTNFIPYLKNQIPNRTDSVGVQFSYTIPDSTFIDDDGNNTLTYSAALSDGSTLPSWLNFNPVTRTLTGNPTTTGSSNIKVTVTDNDSAKAWCTFTIDVVQHTAIDPTGEQIIKEYKLYQNYPNPFNPSTVISYSIIRNSFVSLKIYNILGKEVVTMVNSFQKMGVYDFTLNTDNLNLSSGIYLYSLIANELNTNKVFKETKVMNYIK